MLLPWMEEFVSAAAPLNIEGIVVVRHGEEIGRFHWMTEKRRNQYSVSKSVVSCAVGMAIREGLIGGPDDLVVDYFPDKLPENPSPWLHELTLHHLLTMSMGQDSAYLMSDTRPALREQEQDWVRYILSRPFVCQPGSRFQYTNAAPYLLAKIIQKQSGQNLVDYLMPRLFTPLGIPVPQWETDPEGDTFGSSGLMISVSELALLGQLYLQKGEWDGRQLVPARWVEESSRCQIATATGEEDQPADSAQGYGYLFWRCQPDAYRADGMYGQFAIIIEELDLVIAINSQSTRAQDIPTCCWEHLLPCLPSEEETAEEV